MTDQRPTQPEASAGATRRKVLQTAGLAAVAASGVAALASCASATETATPGTGTSASPASSSTPSSASPSASNSSSADSSTSASASSQAPAGTAVAKADVPEGGGVVLKEKYVVTQPTAGNFKAFTAICTHAGCPVQKIQEREIICPCHGSHFSIDDGARISGPADKPLDKIDFAVSGDSIVIPD